MCVCALNIWILSLGLGILLNVGFSVYLPSWSNVPYVSVGGMVGINLTASPYFVIPTK